MQDQLGTAGLGEGARQGGVELTEAADCDVVLAFQFVARALPPRVFLPSRTVARIAPPVSRFERTICVLGGASGASS